MTRRSVPFLIQFREAKRKPVTSIETLAPDHVLAKEWATRQLKSWGWTEGEVVSVAPKAENGK